MPVTINTRQPDNRLLQITRAAAEAAVALGETIDGVIRKAVQAAILTDARANRRYDELAFYVEGDTIYGVWPYARQSARPAPSAPSARPEPRRNDPQASRPTLSVKMGAPRAPLPPPTVEVVPAGMIVIAHPPCNGTGCPACRYTGTVTQRAT